MRKQTNWYEEAKSVLNYLCDKRDEIEEEIERLQRIIQTGYRRSFEQFKQDMDLE